MPRMPKITEIFDKKKLTFSFELFPPKTQEGYVKLLGTIEGLCNLKPDFISCTHVAGGVGRDLDDPYLRLKIVNVADYVITQLFFNNQDYFDYVVRLRKLGVRARIIPGIFPITDYAALVRFCALCGASIPQEVHDIFKPIAD